MTTHESADDGIDPDPAAGSRTDLSPQDAMLLAEAARSMRTADDSRWVEVSSRVLNTALRATRRSRRLQARVDGGPVYVSEQVLIAYLRDALDGHIPGTAVAGLHLTVTGPDVCTGVVIELIVQYRTAILPVADLARLRAGAVLHELLGPPADQADGWANYVHVSDVTVYDPQTESPS